jgi:FkbM family methyltransferase
MIERVFSQRPGAVMVDVGADIGNHAIYLSRYFSKIVCFEPSPDIVARLSSNIRLNGLTNIDVKAVGLSNRDALLHYKLNRSGNLGASGFQSEANAETVDLPVKRGDDCLQLDRLDFLKVDVEAHELQVFQGLQYTILKHWPIISFEFHGQEFHGHLHGVGRIRCNPQ